MTNLLVSVPSEQLRDDLQPLPDGVEVIEWTMDGAAPHDRIDIVVPPAMRTAGVVPRLKGVDVRLVQSQSIGYDGIADVLPAGLVYANASSVHETSASELALALVLAAQRHIPDFVRSQDEHRWAPLFSESVADRRVLLLGYGGVGRAIAARLAPFEVSLTVVANRPREQEGVLVQGVADLPRLLADAEIVILALPGGGETRHVIGDPELSLLPDGALIVNVGRGPVIDTDALVDHVRRGRLRAALDVTDPEPLPPDHPLWGLPGVLIAPHVGGGSTAMRPRIARLVRTQIERMLRDEPPLNVVIPAPAG